MNRIVLFTLLLHNDIVYILDIVHMKTVDTIVYNMQQSVFFDSLLLCIMTRGTGVPVCFHDRLFEN